MKKSKDLLKLLILIPGIFIYTNAWNQVNNEQAITLPGESIELYTDRYVYAVNENILFSTFIHQHIDGTLPVLSTVVYAELIKWNGAKISQVKIPVENGIAGGSIRIPGDLESGIYYLRAYTKWMRNFSPFSYSYLNLKIVNPTTSKIESGPRGLKSIEKLSEEKLYDSDEAFIFSGLNEVYGTRESIEIDMELAEELSSGIFCLSVNRLGTLEPDQASFSFTSDGDKENESGIEYYPEINGLSLSGNAINKNSMKPLKDISVNLSSSSIPFYYSSVKTDSSGAFHFDFPHISGNYEFNLSAGDIAADSVQLLIESDYCNRPITLPYLPFHLNESDPGIVREISKNMQISQRFLASDASDQTRENDIPFYGRPGRIIYEKDFIELESFEEFLFELLPEVTVRPYNGEPGLYLNQASTLSTYQALVLMDNIQVSNIGDLLKVACRRINRIEILRKGYVVGENYYSGIISIHSEKNDMAGLKQAPNSYFFNFSLFNTQAINSPSYREDHELKNRLPDRRNTLYWNPKIEISNINPVQVRFYTGDTKGDFQLVLRGIGKDGRRIKAERKFRVE